MMLQGTHLFSVDRDKFQLLAERSLHMLSHPATSGNQRPIRTLDEVIEILELVY